MIANYKEKNLKPYAQQKLIRRIDDQKTSCRCHLNFFWANLAGWNPKVYTPLHRWQECLQNSGIETLFITLE
jgi:hypothetical protein